MLLYSAFILGYDDLMAGDLFLESKWKENELARLKNVMSVLEQIDSHV